MRTLHDTEMPYGSNGPDRQFAVMSGTYIEFQIGISEVSPEFYALSPSLMAALTTTVGAPSRCTYTR
jgi:hypothetical protein